MNSQRTDGSVRTVPNPNESLVTRPAVSRTKGVRFLELLWSDWRLAAAVAVGLATTMGLLSAWLTPRGPVTSAEALATMGAAIVVGALAGLALGGRWSVLIPPVAFIAVYEIAWLRVDGPTTDAIHLTSFHGIGAFALGRGVIGLLVLLPMVIAGIYGVVLAGRLGRPGAPTLGWLGWTTTGLVTLSLVVLVVAMARPVSTARIVGADGESLPGSIAELTTVEIGGHDQTLMIRGVSTDNPVILWLAGGPGGTDLGAMRADTSLETDFTVATWDQRGTGKSYPAFAPADTLTLEQMVADTDEITRYLTGRFGHDKIYLAGNSWGTIIGALAVQQQPDLYHAFVPTAQMVSVRETDVMFWEDTIAWAERTGDTGLAAKLRGWGPPPYDDPSRYQPVVFAEHQWNAYPELDESKEMPWNMLVPENSQMDVINGIRGVIDTYAVLYPQIQDLDFRTDIPRLDVPVYLISGRHEARGRAGLANEWFDRLEAPAKEHIIFEHSGHRPSFEEPAEFTALMTRIHAELRNAG